LVRRLNGSRQMLDEAVRAAGVDPGGRPVRVRAIEAGAWLVSDRGLANVTLESVADAANCSVHSLYAIFGSRDELFAAIYEQYSPFKEVLRLSADPSADLERTVAEFYRTTAATLTREPRVAAAMLSDVLGNPRGPAAAVFARYFPRVRAALGGYLTAQMRAGRIRDIPVPLLIQLLMGPLLAHVLMRPVIAAEVDTEQACSVFTSMFLRAVSSHPDNEVEGG
ncbi:MAG TPA: TetR family transcriptional regulator, partial [Mycobacterium sp.]|nr:TetR family transcriptional regulator [Mycobacterium sp.]